MPDPRPLTDAALDAAVRKAFEVGLILRGGFIDVIEDDRRKIGAVVRAALDAADPAPAGPIPLYAVRAIYSPPGPGGEPMAVTMLRHADRAGAERLAEELARLPRYREVRVVEEGEEG